MRSGGGGVVRGYGAGFGGGDRGDTYLGVRNGGCRVCRRTASGGRGVGGVGDVLDVDSQGRGVKCFGGRGWGRYGEDLRWVFRADIGGRREGDMVGERRGSRVLKIDILVCSGMKVVMLNEYSWDDGLAVEACGGFRGVCGGMMTRSREGCGSRREEGVRRVAAETIGGALWGGVGDRQMGRWGYLGGGSGGWTPRCTVGVGGYGCGDIALERWQRPGRERGMDETVYKEWEDRMERAATTASSLEAEQDNSNINKTQSMATLNESLP
ncbi:hypothetical protein Tco_1154050 [Tanacetum coccineum]